MLQFYEAEVVDLAPESAMPGYIGVRIPELFGADTMPTPVGPLFPGTVGGWHSVPPLLTPEGETTRVTVVRMAPYAFKYIGTTQEWSTVNDSQGTICGVRSGDGRHRILVNDSVGIQFVVSSADSSVNTKNYITIGTDGSVMIGTESGSLIAVSEITVSILNAAGDSVLIDSDDGIVIMHHGGVNMISLTTDAVKILGDDVQINANVVNVVGQSGIVFTDDLLGLAPVEPLVLGETFLTDLSAALAQLAAIAALGFPVTDVVAMTVGIATSLATGAPYLSTVTKTA